MSITNVVSHKISKKKITQGVDFRKSRLPRLREIQLYT